MFQLLTGRLPFKGANNYSMIYQIINVDPPRPIEVRPDIPPRIDAIVMRALQKETTKRYQTWDDYKTVEGSAALPLYCGIGSVTRSGRSEKFRCTCAPPSRSDRVQLKPLEMTSPIRQVVSVS